MAISTTTLKARIAREFALLGFASGDSEIDDLLADAVSRFVAKMDHPVISASLSVVSGTAEYTVPATLDPARLVDVRNADGDSEEYSFDSTNEKITIATTPTAAATWTVYGLPTDPRTNVATVVAAIKTQFEFVLWAYIRAFAHSMKNSSQFIDRLKEADKLANDMRQDRNWDLSLKDTTVQSIDTRGRRIADSSNVDGLIADVSDQFESDL